MKTAIGVIVARFQTPYLHQGHLSLIEGVQQRHSRMAVVLGTQPVRGSMRNPYDFQTRERMLKAQFPALSVLPLADRASDAAWSQGLDRLLAETFPGEGVVLYGSRDSFLGCYSGKNRVEELPESGQYSATLLRQELSELVLESEDFRQGILYAHSRLYPTAYTTVDVALFSQDRSQLLLVRKPEEEHWGLPGGFADPTDPNFETAALRELREECGPLEVSGLRYEGSFQVEDWRYRREPNKIFTLLYSATHLKGTPLAGDDVEAAFWFDLELLPEKIEKGQLLPAHIPMLQQLLKEALVSSH